ncbi:DEAD/DEAH box helicase family protein, partial [Planctomycetota bacterium]
MIWDESRSRVGKLAEGHSVANLTQGLSIERRPFQMRITVKAIQMLQGQFRQGNGSLDREAESVMIESPTGSGKTVMGLLIARWMQQRHGFSIGWVATRGGQLDQVQVENERRGFGVDIKPISLYDTTLPKV